MPAPSNGKQPPQTATVSRLAVFPSNPSNLVKDPPVGPTCKTIVIMLPNPRVLPHFPLLVPQQTKPHRRKLPRSRHQKHLSPRSHPVTSRSQSIDEMAHALGLGRGRNRAQGRGSVPLLGRRGGRTARPVLLPLDKLARARAANGTVVIGVRRAGEDIERDGSGDLVLGAQRRQAEEVGWQVDGGGQI